MTGRLAGGFGGLLILLMGAVNPAWSAGSVTGGFPRLDGGARGAGLGGVFTAAAEGSESIHWNPAGLLSLERRELSFTYADLYGLGLVSHGAVQFGWPRVRTEVQWEGGRIRRVPQPGPADYAFGLMFSNLRGELGQEDYVEVQAGLALAWRMPLGAQAGLAYRFLSAQSGFRDAGGSGHALDLGVQRPWGPLRLGLAAIQLASTTRWKGSPDGTRFSGLDEPLAERWSLGLAWSPRTPPVTLSLQGDWSGSHFAATQRGLSAEWRPRRPFSLRGAWRQRQDALGWRGEWSAGTGFDVGGFRLDYGWRESGQGLGDTHRWSAAIAL